jgi:hypothetical protein
LLSGAVKLTVAVPLPAATTMLVGAPGAELVEPPPEEPPPPPPPPQATSRKATQNAASGPRKVVIMVTP